MIMTNITNFKPTRRYFNNSPLYAAVHRRRLQRFMTTGVKTAR